MPKPLITVETIYKAALHLLDEEGPHALSARNLAAALQCSTRTLYQQVGKREELIGRLIDYHFAGQQLVFEPQSTWQASVVCWASILRGALLAHPNLARLMTVEHRGPVADYVNELLKVLLKAGFTEALALRSCRVLVNVAISLTLSELQLPAGETGKTRRNPKEIAFERKIAAKAEAGSRHSVLHDDPRSYNNTAAVFDSTIGWLLAGMERDLADQS